MELTEAQCYQAVKSRDPRFDGRFFTGVHSTGIYCRTICPARIPLRKNIRFYRHAVQAESDGLRPCLRCRPETAPGTPAWNGTSTTVNRALRLIDQGLGEDWALAQLAARLGVTDRHLRRLFHQHFGVSPIAVIQQHRVQLAKQLLSDTLLPVTQIAFASGFKSVRRFNHRFKETYGMSPRDIRRRREIPGCHREGLTLALTYRPPYDLDHLFSYLRVRAIPGVESIEGHTYQRMVQFGDVTGVIRVCPEPIKNRMSVTLEPQLVYYLPEITARIRHLFDLQCDPEAIHESLRSDPVLKPLLTHRPGLRLPGTWCPFELGVRTIVGQQVSVKGASTLAERLVRKYGAKRQNGANDTVAYAFPTPDRLSRARVETIGMPKKRGAAIRAFARAVALGDVRLQAYESAEEQVEKLVALPGIGPWTAQYIAMRGMGEPDGFPVDDLGLIVALEKLEGRRLKGKALLERAEAWRPWRGYATMYLWASLADEFPKEKEA